MVRILGFHCCGMGSVPDGETETCSQKKRHTDGQQVHEKVFIITNHQGNANQNHSEGYAGDAVVKNPHANAGDTSSSPGPGRSHMPWSN